MAVLLGVANVVVHRSTFRWNLGGVLARLRLLAVSL